MRNIRTNTMPVILALLLSPISCSAQWANFPTPGLPRTPDGRPNLSAPAPKAPDGKPDLSGVWEHLTSRTTAYYGTGALPQEGGKLRLDT